MADNENKNNETGELTATVEAIKVATITVIDKVSSGLTFSKESSIEVPKDILSEILEKSSPLPSASEKLKQIQDEAADEYKELYQSMGTNSPFDEIAQLSECINKTDKYVKSRNDCLSYLEEKCRLLALLNQILALSVDCKWALQMYNSLTQLAISGNEDEEETESSDNAPY